MISDKLFDEILLKPARAGANVLHIVSGYATAAMASNHLAQLTAINNNISVNLIIGMTPLDGLSITNHKGFIELSKNFGIERFSCSYLIGKPPAHSKVYSWFKNDKPFQGYLGSANYTQKAFSIYQRELMEITDPVAGREYFNLISPQTIYCDNLEADSSILIYSTKDKEPISATGKPATELSQTQDSQNVLISLLGNQGNLPTRSGLNWGQRPEAKREPNQAYIRVPANIAKSNFFPDRAIQFTILTDDDKILICAVAQDGDKAIHSTLNNSQIGEYFRRRLGVANGKLITRDDLAKYGRTDLSFYKIDDETYFMDFSV